jgi:hypothetical protein
MAYGMRTVRTSRRWQLAPLHKGSTALAKQVPEMCLTVFRREPAATQKPKQTKRGQSRASLLRRSLLAFMLLGLSPIAGYGQGRVEIVTVPALWVTPSTETPLIIRLSTSEPMPSQAMLLVRGLPPATTLSEGRPFGPGVWVVPLNLVSQLRLRAPAENSRSDLSLALVLLDGKLLAESKLTLFIAPPAGGRQDTVPMAAPPIKQMTAEERENANKLMERGHESLNAGNVSVAQKFYERAAERGLAEAAMALGGTYDERELARLKLKVEPNPALARQWYEKARDLGSRDAEARLWRLP